MILLFYNFIIFFLLPFFIVAKHFPHDFKWGVALSSHQYCGAQQLPHSNWGKKWEKKPGRHQSKSACDHWNRYEQDLQLLKDLNLNAIRFSVDWSALEPTKGKFNKSVLEYYKKYCMKCKELGISIMITLHHFTHPQWFEELGAFEKVANIRYFVRFCKLVFTELNEYVDLWCTINEPTVLVLQGYFRGVYPPEKINPILGLKVLRNLMQAHTDAYLALKELAGEKDIHVGFVHSYTKFDPCFKWNALERIPGYLFNYILNEAVIDFCRTGEFKITPWAPEFVSVFLPKGIKYITPSFFNYKTPYKKRSLDFFGLNYYSHIVPEHKPTLFNPFNIVPSCWENETMTDMPYGMYPQGLYNAIADVATMGLPIYITENGIADAADTRREKFLRDYLGALQQALNDSYAIKGYYYWSLFDNFEWDMGYSMKFGLYEVDFDTQERKLREGSRYYPNFIKECTES